MLRQIFREVESDPTWFEDSFLYELYSKRIPIDEFMSLLTSDDEWSHLANEMQTKKVLNLFDKVYGFAQTMSRMKQLQMMHKKRIQNVNTKVKTSPKTVNEDK